MVLMSRRCSLPLASPYIRRKRPCSSSSSRESELSPSIEAPSKPRSNSSSPEDIAQSRDRGEAAPSSRGPSRETVSRLGPREDGAASPLSLDWAMSSGEDEFERGLEGASMEGLNSLSRELDEEQGRLRRMYGEARGSEQRRLIKTMIRQVAANSGSVEASITAHEDNRPPAR